MQSIVLAAGLGSRLKPLTDNCPKCMVSLNGIPLIKRQIAVLNKIGISNVHVAAGYLAEKITLDNVSVSTNVRYRETNMAYTLFNALESLGSVNSDLLISYGDIVFTDKVIETIFLSDAPISVAVDLDWRDYWQQRMTDPLLDAETLVLDQNDNIIEIGKKPSSYSKIMGQYIGLIKIRKDFLQLFRSAWNLFLTSSGKELSEAENTHMTSFLQYLIDKSWQIHAVYIRGGWVEIDSVNDLLIAESMPEFFNNNV